MKSSGVHLPSPDGLYDVSNPIDAFFHVGASPIAQVIMLIFEILNSYPFKYFQRYLSQLEHWNQLITTGN